MDQPWLLVLAVAAVAAAAVWARSARYRQRQLRRSEAAAADPDAIALVRSDLRKDTLAASMWGLVAITAVVMSFRATTNATVVLMVLVIPALFFVAGLISLRILQLDGTDRWDFPWAAGIGIICMQVGAGLHYWPITPIQFGLELTGLLYALTMLSARLNNENIPLRNAAAGPVLIVIIASLTALFIR